MPFTRHPKNPILAPDPLSHWESLNVFNPGLVYHQGLFHMLYRAQGLDYVSSIGYAVSADGVHFNRLREPVFSPQGPDETRGVEDPRLTYLAEEGRFIMAYTAYSDRGITPMFAQSDNLITWHRIGSLVQGEDNKDHVLFPKKFGGDYLSFHRRPPSICFALSKDLRRWKLKGAILKPRVGMWDGNRVGAGGVPIETKEGWLVIYHGYDQDNVYRLSACLLDLEEPWRVIQRAQGFFMEPSEIWEQKGDVPNVVFSCANPVIDETVYLYYAGADRMIGLATAKLADVIDFVNSA
jgi:beta-1,2-mannobiose phosphorylase / 1,2-beta-oligomannan phosphorylase